MKIKHRLEKTTVLLFFLIFLSESILTFTTGSLVFYETPIQNTNEPVGNDWWPMFRHDPAGSGLSTAPAPEVNSVLWTYQTNISSSSSPTVAHGRVYIGSGDWNLYCFGMDSGLLLWNFTTNSEILSAPAVFNGKVYVSSADGKLYCLNAIDGSFLWDYPTYYGIGSSPIVVDSRVFFGSFDGSLYCLDSEYGNLLWRYITNNVIIASPAVSNGKVYCGTTSGMIFCLNYTTGAPVWIHTMDAGTYSSPTIHSGKMFFGSNDYTVYCLDAADGTILWNYSTQSEVHASPAVANNFVYIGTYNGQLQCLQKDTGVFQWSYQINGAIESSPAVSDGKLYFGTAPCCGFSSYFICLNAYSGTLIWQYNLNTPFQMRSSPAIAAGKIFVGSPDGKVIAFGDIEYLADANGPYYQTVNHPVDFTGSVYGGEPGFSWYWNFGDMLTSTEQNPSHVYSIIGTYTVTLDVTDNQGTVATDHTTVSITSPNRPPGIPLVDGPSVGTPGELYTYTFVSLDPDGDYLYYDIDWGDNTTGQWKGPFFLGDPILEDHLWSDTGRYLLRARTKDRHGAVSNWSTPLEINIIAPDLQIEIGGGLGFVATIQNNGNGPATNVSWEIALGGFFVFPSSKTGLILMIPSGEYVRVRTFMIGLGKTTIVLSVKSNEGPSFERTAEALLLGFFLLNVR